MRLPELTELEYKYVNIDLRSGQVVWASDIMRHSCRHRTFLPRLPRHASLATLLRSPHHLQDIS